MKLSIWVVLGIYERKYNEHVIALFFDWDLAETRRSKMQDDEECLSAEVFRFEAEGALASSKCAGELKLASTYLIDHF